MKQAAVLTSIRRWLRRRRGDAIRELRAAAELCASTGGAPAEAWSLAAEALADARDGDALRALAGLARGSGDVELARALSRAADDPSDTARLADAGAALTRAGALDAAAALLERALALAPFDAVLRSELALALARAARPAESAAVLALHPCLAEDPGALFQFAWSSLLAGDARAARACVPQLAGHAPARALARVLDEALERDAHAGEHARRDLRDWVFVEHGALLLDATRAHDALDPDDAVLVREVARRAAEALRALGAIPARVVAGTEPALPAARAIAAALGLDRAEPPPRAGVPAGLLVARSAADLAASWEHVASRGEVRTLALVLAIDDAPIVPDLVGAIARREGAGTLATDPREPDAIARFAAARRALLPPARERTARAFTPDAPLAWPARAP